MLDPEGLRLRSALFQAIRSFFNNRQFLEVDTPVRQPVVIPEPTIVPVLSGHFFLQPSPEQCMKRLLGQGCSRLFQICPCFRADERGRRHLEEFTMLEWYRRDADYNDLMEDCRELLRYVVLQLKSDSCFKRVIDESPIANMDIDDSWPKLRVEDAFTAYCPISLLEALKKDLFEEMLVEHVEPRLGINRPVFLCDYPAEHGSLARKKAGFPNIAERFELYINGLELANGFSELTDPDEQRQRFEEDIQKIASDDLLHYSVSMPEKFLEDLGLIGSAAGIALGVDRLLMLIMSADSINDVVSFSPEDW